MYSLIFLPLKHLFSIINRTFCVHLILRKKGEKHNIFFNITSNTFLSFCSLETKQPGLNLVCNKQQKQEILIKGYKKETKIVLTPHLPLDLQYSVGYAHGIVLGDEKSLRPFFKAGRSWNGHELRLLYFFLVKISLRSDVSLTHQCVWTCITIRNFVNNLNYAYLIFLSTTVNTLCLLR